MHYYAIPGLNRKSNLRRRTYMHVKSVEEIIKMVSEKKEISATKMFSKSRKRELVYARQLCAYLLVKFSKLTLKVIGQRLGGRDHTTVGYSNKTIKDLIDSDPLISHEVEELEMLVVKTIN